MRGQPARSEQAALAARDRIGLHRGALAVHEVTQRVDAALNDRLMVAYLVKTANLPLRPGAVVPGATTQVAIPFRKDNPKFAQAVNHALDDLRKDGTLGKLSVKWFGADVTKPAGKPIK